MPFTPVQLPPFVGSLNLRDQPSSVDPSQAIDCLNTVPIGRFGLRERDGYGAFNSAPGTNRYDSLAAYYKSDGTRQLLAGAGNRLEALTTAGAVSVSSTAPTTNPHFFARFGGPTQEVMFCANGADQLRQWNGAAFSTPGWTGTAPTGKFVAVTPWDNRLVNARRTGATAGDNRSSVRFSAQGDPTTWGANDFVDLTPGDGEEITGVAVYQDKVFVFKESKFFWFYNTVADGTGKPTFYYHTVDTGVGCVASKAIAVARDGVYFLDRRGVYRTQGGPPDLVSDLLDPLFYGSQSDFYLGGTVNMAAIASAAMTWHCEQIYCAIPSGASTTNDKTLLFDPRYGWWTLYDLQAAALASFRISDRSELVFALAAGNKDIARHSASFTTDAGTAIATRWKSGWFDLGSSQVKTMRELKLWGKGSLFVGVGVDYQPADNLKVVQLGSAIDTWGDGTGPDLWEDGTNLNDLWGAGQSLAPALYRSAVRGSVFSIELRSNGANTWGLFKASAHMRSQRNPTTLSVPT